MRLCKKIKKSAPHSLQYLCRSFTMVLSARCRAQGRQSMHTINATRLNLIAAQPRFTVRASRLAELQKAVAKLSKKSVKCGGGEIGIDVVGGGRDVVKTHSTAAEKIFVTYPLAVVALTGTTEAPRLPGGWQLVAAVDCVGAANVVRSVPGIDVDIDAKFWRGGIRCEHCNTHRRRKNGFLVADSDGVVRMVGRQCLKDYTGHTNPAAVARWFEALNDFAGYLKSTEEEEGMGGFSGKRSTCLDVIDVLSQAAALIRVDGYSKGGGTAGDFWSVKFPFGREIEAGREWREERQPVEEDFEMAHRALAWARAVEIETANGYMRNVGAILSNDYVDENHVGIAVSAVHAYRREIGQVAARAARENAAAQSEHVGTVGEKITVRAVVESVRTFDTQWGMSCLLTFVDDDGNVIKWFTKKWLDEGDRYEITARVKEHGEWKGNKQTTITRAKLATV